MHPGSSGGVLVFVKDTTEAVTPVDVQPGELVRVGDRFGQRLQRPDVRDPLMGRFSGGRPELEV
jgi:hypothetical protein